MIPPLRRRCPECDHADWSHRFAPVVDEGAWMVECPSCRHRFETVDGPLLR